MEFVRQINFRGACFFLAAGLMFPSAALFATGGDALDAPAMTLGESLDFLPGKSLGEIFLERGTQPADDEIIDPSAQIRQIAARLRTESPAKLFPAVDALLAQARQHYASKGDWCNLLHDVRDVLVGSVEDQNAAADYIEWRIAHTAIFFASPQTDDSGKPQPLSPNEYNIQERAAQATGPLRAHWLYLCGAAKYRIGERGEAREFFERVLMEFPKHPRAESALFMQARCAFAKTRETNDGEPVSAPGWSDERKNAAELFQNYLAKYPRGSFVADSLGWLGALAFDAADYLRSLEFYIAQAETPGHPETLKSAIFMCERALGAVAAKPDGPAAFALISRHPRIAMGFAYLVLSAPEANNYDGKFDRPADVKKWRREILPRIAAAVVQQKEIYQSGDWQPRYLALLAQSASAQGNQEQALQLTNLAPAALAQSDDLLLVRAIAFQRAGKNAEAITTYRKFLSRFPHTPMTPGVRLRLAFALQDNRQAGEALIEFLRLRPPNEEDNSAGAAPADQGTVPNDYGNSIYTASDQWPESVADWSPQTSGIYPNITGANLSQLEQAIDTLLNFAPLPELAAALPNDGLAEAEKDELRRIIAERYLAQENFAEARKFLPPERFELVAEKIGRLTNAAQQPGPDQPAAMARLGDAWAAARGQLLRAPLDTLVKMARPYALFSGTERRANGRSLQLKNVDDELSARDELRHAARWWLAAARAQPGTPLAAHARWEALETMPKIARVSDYAETLAREINAGAVSREIYDKLRHESPDSIEAKRLAAYWNFPPAPAPNEPAEHTESEQRDDHLMGYSTPDFGAFGVEEYPNEPGRFGRDFWERVAALPGLAATLEPAQFAAEVRVLDQMRRKNLLSIEDATLMNFLDDLVQFTSEPKITREMQAIYCALRFDILESNGWNRPEPNEPFAKKDADISAEIAQALTNPAMRPVADYLEFSRIGLLAGNRTQLETDIVDPKGDGVKVTITSRDYAGMEKMARDFLQKYPRSRKREAALFVIARCVQARSRPVICEVGIPQPGTSPAEELFDVVEKSYQPEPFDSKRVLTALDDYDREYPNGRYAAEVRNLRAMTLWRTRDWNAALDLTIAQLEDRTHEDLRWEASVRLANIFAQLEPAENRSDLLAAIRARPAALAYLRKFLAPASTYRSHPLRYLQDYLNDQLGLASVGQK